ncbi:MAG: ATP-dependent RecD-like DNA helicase [Eubacteriaceae bacterium]|nr:ATP-dependent RecD-like DNA helicase [Eubacteriaceae bacterium]
MEKVSGTITRVVFNNPDNHYSVIALDTEFGSLVANGTMYAINEGESVTLEGDFQEHPKYGKQFKFTSFFVEQPTDLYAVQRLLESRLIDGVGEVKAVEIIKMFGDETIDVIEKRPHELTMVRGIGLSTAMRIHESYMQTESERATVMVLTKYGITTALAIKLHNKYSSNAISIVEMNPYQLISDVEGIGFSRADEIAAKVGVDPVSPMRVWAALTHAAKAYSQAGHCYCIDTFLVNNAVALTRNEISRKAIEEQLALMIESGEFTAENGWDGRRVYLPYYYYCEQLAANKISQLAKRKSDLVLDIHEMINMYEKADNITLEAKQREAIAISVSHKVSIITGGPGTGKTTIIKGIIFVLKLLGATFILGAPTGRAAKKIHQSTGNDAKTIHRMLEYEYSAIDGGDEGLSFKRCASNPLEQSTVIIDEASMLDASIFAHLMSAIDTKITSLVIVGDKDQLPSIGAGNVLGDLISSGCLPVVYLDRVYRQSEESMIIENAHRINNGEMPSIKRDGDFVFVEAKAAADISKAMGTFLSAKDTALYETIDWDATQVISPIKRGEAGTAALNQKIQLILNPPSDGKNEMELFSTVFREGDKIMQTKNNYSIEWEDTTTKIKGSGIFNGEIGTIEYIDNENALCVVLFDERRVEISRADMNTITHAYAITVHKSQGSEFETVVLALMPTIPSFMTRNLLYTAVTRAKERVVIIGDPYTLKGMVSNNSSMKRMSALNEKISALGD